MRHDQDAAVAAATVADDARSALLADLLGRVAGCFPRRETRQCCGQMVRGLLMELDDHNCWTIAEAVGHRGPHRLQHLLSRAVWDDQHMADIASAWAVSYLDDGDAVLIVDETADEKSSAEAVGAARQYSGTVGGIALCQVAVTLTYATSRGHALIGRALYLPEGCAADEEHRELAGVPEEVMFATKPQLASALLDRAQSLGIGAAFVAGDEVYGGRELRRGIRQRGMGYVMAVRANHTRTTGSGRTVTAAEAVGMYQRAVDDGLIAEADNPARKVAKPRRLPTTRRALPDARLAEINEVAATTGDDPELDTLILRLHTETACRRGGALALRPRDLDPDQYLILLQEKGETVRWQPVSPTLMARLIEHGHDRHAPADGQLLRYADWRPITSRRYDHLWTRIGRHLPWVATQGISSHWIRHTILTWVERNFGYAVARAYAGHTDGGSEAGATSTYVRASLSEVAAALAALTGEPHPLATAEGW